MYLLDHSMNSLGENLALDEALLEWIDTDCNTCEILRFWESSQYGVVLGASRKYRDDVRIDACQRNTIPVVRRSSGGGTVLVGPGCLNIALLLQYDRHPALTTIGDAHQYVLQRVMSALQPMMLPEKTLHSQGIADLCLDDRKVGGTAQRRCRNSLLYHMSLLCHFSIPEIERYLKEPVDQPDYRQRRNHRDFLINLEIDLETCKSALCQTWGTVTDRFHLPVDRVKQLAQDQFNNDQWTYRR